MARKLRILCVHGVGGHPPGGRWEREWKQAILGGLSSAQGGVEPEFAFVHYDDLFARERIGVLDVLEAIAKLAGSAVSAPFRKTRGMGGGVRMTAGMVVKWVESSRFRRSTRKRVVDAIESFDPHVVVAHSLGSLVCYDTFTDDRTSHVLGQRTFVSLGSQIGNPFVSGNFMAGRIQPLAGGARWFHLFNDEDAVFTAPIQLYDESFQQVLTPFDVPGIADHSAAGYLSHENTVATVWYELSAPAAERSVLRRTAPVLRKVYGRETPKRRALLIGINEYRDPGVSTLDGCVNDCFLMSAALQETGYRPEDIRVVLNERATSGAIRTRLEWLFEGVRKGAEHERVLYYSGHGAQLPTYGEGDAVDSMDESFVPHDFDWSLEHSFTDDDFYDLYSQLPYDARFVAIFDCCHSGGMTRGGAPKVRGIDPPDDIRHRAMQWNRQLGMWEERSLEGARGHAAGRSRPGKPRLGCAQGLRSLSKPVYRRKRRARDHHGPYMPALFYACREDQFAYEYRHGTTAHGAFTFSLVKNLRRIAAAERRRPTFAELRRGVASDLRRLGFEQNCELFGPDVVLDAPVPFGRRRSRRKA